MKKIVISLILISCIMLSGCSSSKAEKDFYDNGKYIRVDITSNLASFNLMLLSKDKIENVTYESVVVDGIAPQDLTIDITKNSLETLEHIHYKGLYFDYYMVEIQANEEFEELQISELNLSVDGETRAIQFPNAIIMKSGDATKLSGQLEPSVLPNEFGSSFLSGKEHVIYSLNAKKTFTFTEITANDFVQANPVVQKNEPSIFEQKLNGEVNVELILSTEEKEYLNCYIETSLFFRYECDGEKDYLQVPVVFDPIYPLADNDTSKVEQLMDNIIE